MLETLNILGNFVTCQLRVYSARLHVRSKKKLTPINGRLLEAYMRKGKMNVWILWLTALVGIVSSQAPQDVSSYCVDHSLVPNYPDTVKPLMDSWSYENLLGSDGVWQSLNLDEYSESVSFSRATISIFYDSNYILCTIFVFQVSPHQALNGLEVPSYACYAEERMKCMHALLYELKYHIGNLLVAQLESTLIIGKYSQLSKRKIG